jgi:hypothetical protein
MKAIDVYNINKNKIRQMADFVRTEKGETVSDIIHDKESDMDMELIASSFAKVGAESPVEGIRNGIRGIHTRCDIAPIGIRDFRMACAEVSKKEAKELKNCLAPIAEDLDKRMKEIIGNGKIMREILKPHTREETRELHKLLPMHLGKKIVELNRDYDEYIEKNCEPCKNIKKTYTGILIQGKKITVE